MAFARLPLEVLRLIYKQLLNCDIKNLRLVSSFFQDTAQLRLDRVFLSANPLNVAVFQAIAENEKFRQGIVEIVWDDALFIADPNADRDPYDLETDNIIYGHDNQNAGCPRWFENAYVENRDLIEGLDSRRPDPRRRTAELNALLSPAECWAYYQTILQQQDQVLTTGADIDAFRRGLERFPALRRVTITPVAHGKMLFNPHYQTPMIRAMPKGFNYLIPPGWPTEDQSKAEIEPWESETEKSKWRGFCVVTRLLAENMSLHHVDEFVIDVAQAMTGLNCYMFERIFDGPNPEYDHLSSLIGRPGFRRLDLALLLGTIQYHSWTPLRNGRLLRMLESAKDLEHFYLRTDIEDTSFMPDKFVSLHKFLPIAQWSRLRYFGLSCFMVRQTDLLSILADMPETLEEVSLSFLDFLDEESKEDGRGSLKYLLWEIKTTLKWDQRAIRPRFSIGIPWTTAQVGRGIWIEEEANAYLYGDGSNPFGRDGISGNCVPRGVGVAKDTFDESYEQPWADGKTLERLGFQRKLSWTGYTGPGAIGGSN